MLARKSGLRYSLPRYRTAYKKRMRYHIMLTASSTAGRSKPTEIGEQNSFLVDAWH